MKIIKDRWYEVVVVLALLLWFGTILALDYYNRDYVDLLKLQNNVLQQQNDKLVRQNALLKEQMDIMQSIMKDIFRVLK